MIGKKSICVFCNDGISSGSRSKIKIKRDSQKILEKDFHYKCLQRALIAGDINKLRRLLL